MGGGSQDLRKSGQSEAALADRRARKAQATRPNGAGHASDLVRGEASAPSSSRKTAPHPRISEDCPSFPRISQDFLGKYDFLGLPRHSRHAFAVELQVERQDVDADHAPRRSS